MRKIKYLRQNQIDKLLWDRCISESVNSRIYAYSWFLDCMTENWDALIVGNYETVMPLPWKSKFGLKYIYHPPFIQQLGVFSMDNSIDIFQFLSAIPKHFVIVDYFFSCENFDEGWKKFAKRKRNFVLNINKPYSEIEKAYKIDLKKNIKSAISNKCEFLKSDKNFIPDLISLYRNAYGKFHNTFDEKVYQKISNLMGLSIDNSWAGIYIANLHENKIGAANFILKDKNRIYYFFGAPSELGKKNKCTPFLINSIIKEHAEKPLLFDFEGSEIPSVASFYEKFSPDTEYYYQVKYFNILGLKI